MNLVSNLSYKASRLFRWFNYHFTAIRWMVTWKNYRAYRWMQLKGEFRGCPEGMYVVICDGELRATTFSATSAHSYAKIIKNEGEIFIQEVNGKSRIVGVPNTRLTRNHRRKNHTRRDK